MCVCVSGMGGTRQQHADKQEHGISINVKQQATQASPCVQSITIFLSNVDHIIHFCTPMWAQMRSPLSDLQEPAPRGFGVVPGDLREPAPRGPWIQGPSGAGSPRFWTFGSWGGPNSPTLANVRELGTPQLPNVGQCSGVGTIPTPRGPEPSGASSPRSPEPSGASSPRSLEVLISQRELLTYLEEMY